ncbi:ring-opening amidohydrolase [Allorhizobium sp. BGMRC 0089]|uniref:cyanuric acid amidohydrolase n=1 Tax=Allorhizobium sonneratiae TaxID=2934936 RepID=UPI0020347396|nr:ring-opening amidohydrolase [Allorhizobium sonneratiae]MCM2293869.1 ring-opening amidohydrolase [Allorhizobium sonneratiae]
MRVGVHKIRMDNPGDVSDLRRQIEAGSINPHEIVAMIGKTEGNGGANDFTRGFATQSLSLLLAPYLDLSPEAVTSRIAFVWSGGTEGVLSPHTTVFTRSEAEPAGAKRLAIGIAMTRDLLPEEVGTMVEVREVAKAVRSALDEAGIDDPGDVHYVQVKGPLLTPASVADAQRRGVKLVTTDPNGSKPYARGATALGVAVALGEVDEAHLSDDAIARRMDLYSSVANTSAGGELRNCEILLFGNSAKAGGDLRIGHAVLRDVVDRDAVLTAIANAAGENAAADGALERVKAIFAKAEAPVGGMLRGCRTTMLSDADIHYERHARAALGAVITSVTGDAKIFVSGGTEHQCKPGEAPIAAIVQV